MLVIRNFGGVLEAQDSPECAATTFQRECSEFETRSVE